MSSERLAVFLREVSGWTWDDFVRAEKNNQYTSNQSIIFALIRACAMQQLSAIKVAINRLDGKLKTPVKVEYPKVYYLFPNAKLSAPDLSPPLQPPLKPLEPLSPGPVMSGEIILPHGEVGQLEGVTVIPEERDLATMSLRETLTEMADLPRELPEAIIQLAEQTHRWIQGLAPQPDEIPKVKSVVAAHLLTMAQNRNVDAINEVFDQIDGKLVETIQIIGEDIHIVNYSQTAPPEAKLNDDGVLQVEAKNSQETWAQKLGKED